MDSVHLIFSVGLGGAICMIILVSIWFVNNYLKKRFVPGQGGRAAVRLHETFQKDKRQHPRVDITLPVRIETSQGTIEGETINISLGGAFICCQRPLPLRENFRLAVDAPNHDSLTVNAEVIWSNINVPDEKILNRGMGIRFIEITKADREFLNHVLSAHHENSAG
jgi:uncharacterized protein (TIGR02266 family)